MNSLIIRGWTTVAIIIGLWWVSSLPALAEQKGEKSFTAIVTDAQGVETEIKNAVFYWEEKLSETAFVPHELRHLPVKRGSSTINVRFDQIKQIEHKLGTNSDADGSMLVLTLHNGKTGEFSLATPGSFRGESDFGQTDVPVRSISKVVFK
jgi:hypothetical protein